jgi:hypothetical protein
MRSKAGALMAYKNKQRLQLTRFPKIIPYCKKNQLMLKNKSMTISVENLR